MIDFLIQVFASAVGMVIVLCGICGLWKYLMRDIEKYHREKR